MDKSGEVRLIELMNLSKSEHTVFVTPPEIPHLPNVKNPLLQYRYSRVRMFEIEREKQSNHSDLATDCGIFKNPNFTDP